MRVAPLEIRAPNSCISMPITISFIARRAAPAPLVQFVSQADQNAGDAALRSMPSNRLKSYFPAINALFSGYRLEVRY